MCVLMLQASGTYDYAVVQATESSAGFYDRMGFVRVGALARYIPPGRRTTLCVSSYYYVSAY